MHYAIPVLCQIMHCIENRIWKTKFGLLCFIQDHLSNDLVLVFMLWHQQRKKFTPLRTQLKWSTCVWTIPYECIKMCVKFQADICELPRRSQCERWQEISFTFTLGHKILQPLFYRFSLKYLPKTSNPLFYKAALLIRMKFVNSMF